jgi:hypothetical protein
MGGGGLHNWVKMKIRKVIPPNSLAVLAASHPDMFTVLIPKNVKSNQVFPCPRWVSSGNISGKIFIHNWECIDIGIGTSSAFIHSEEIKLQAKVFI